ncbi:PAS domain-containing protein [Sphingomonas sp. PL-96]|uniref:PAS domain-containing protein n=1 Tax=Sphingomonas sp. PL-96 TaxID=2887201 RepID=UPI001E64442B|nr:PAS domain-containing protein [Sphingomonas sp. PL-96]MCC2977036.1 PAS domain-containing protein [Sphingomonas sp. PL-96]
MATRIREKNWSSTPLGARDTWPLELTTTLGLILDSAFPLYLLWGDDLVSFFNDSYAKVLGKKPDALGRSFRDVWPEIWDEFTPIFATARSGKATWHENKRLLLERGHGLEETWWTFSFSPVRDAGDRVAGILCTTWETTKLVLAEREAARQAAELTRFSALVPELLWVTRGPGYTDWANQRMIDFLGLDPATRGADWPSVVHPDDVQAVALRFEKAQRQRVTFESRHRLRRADGEYRWVLARSEPVFGPDGEVEGWYGAATDMHDWHLAAEAMRSKEELFETFARSSRKVLWMIDAATQRIEYMSGDTAHIWGEQTASQITSWDDWVRTVHPEDRDRQTDFLPRLLDGELISEEYRVIGDHGLVRRVRETLFPIPDKEGHIHSVGGIAERIDADEVHQVYLVGLEPVHEARLAGCFWRKGFKSQTFEAIDQFVKIAPALQPGCILFEAGVPTSLGRILGALGSRRTAFRTIALTPHHDDAGEVRSLMKMGAFDVLPDSGGSEERLLRIVREALLSLSAAPNDAVPAAQSARQRLLALSAREREVLTRLMAGLSSKLIAKELGLSPRTVEVHRAKIKERLQVGTLSEALALAASAGLTS